jgi:hypothetical protein
VGGCSRDVHLGWNTELKGSRSIGEGLWSSATIVGASHKRNGQAMRVSEYLAKLVPMVTAIARPLNLPARIAALITLLALPSMAQNFHVEGVLEYGTVVEGNKVSPLARRAFGVDVDSCRWRIRSRPVDQMASAGDAALYAEITNSFDGIYKLTVYDGETLRRSSTAASSYDGKKVELVTNAMSVVGGDVPFLDETFATVPWLAFASSCFFETNHDQRVKKFLTMNRQLFDNKDVTVTAETDLTTTAPRLPQHISFMNEGFAYVAQQDGTVRRQPLPAPFDKGFEEASYTVEQFTTVSNYTLPKAFTINYFATKKGAASRDDRRLVGVIRGGISLVAASSLSVSDAGARIAQPSGNSGGTVYVADRRVGSPTHPITYFTTGPVYQVGDPRLKEKERIAALRRKQPASSPKYRLFVWGALLVVTISFASLAWRTRERTD